MTRRHGRHNGGWCAAVVRWPQCNPLLQPGKSRRGDMAGAAWTSISARFRSSLRSPQPRARPADGQRLCPSMACRRSPRICGSCPSATRMKGLYETLGLMITHIGRSALGGRAVRAFRASGAGGTRLRPRSRTMRGNRCARRPRLCLAEERAGGQPHGGRAMALTACLRCRPFSAPSPAPVARALRGSPEAIDAAFRLTGSSCTAISTSRAGIDEPIARASFHHRARPGDSDLTEKTPHERSRAFSGQVFTHAARHHRAWPKIAGIFRPGTSCAACWKVTIPAPPMAVGPDGILAWWKSRRAGGFRGVTR